MKKRVIIIAVLLAAALLTGFRYMVVEQNDILPDEVRLTLGRFLGLALAETEPPLPAETPVPTPEPTATPVPTPVPTPEPLLERGDSGEKVKALQERLRELGFMTGAADGKFGPKTEQAVVDFKQHLSELEQERDAAERAEAEAQAAIQAQAEGEIPPADGSDSSGLTEADAAEEATENAPENAGDGEAPVPADEGEAMNPDEVSDGLNGAVQPDVPGAAPVFEGKVDEETYRLLVEKGFDEYQMRLSGGMRSAEVRRLQQRLKTLGYLSGKADGIFGKQTTRAVTAFQKRHSLTQDGIAGERTQRALFSASALKQVKPSKPYLLKVSTEKQRVYAYAWSEADAAYTKLVRTMVCSTGLADTPTPKGTYTSTTTPVVRWGYFPKYDVWAQYLYRISGPYLFHSVLYEEADESTVKWGSVNKLGSPASHGCIRLSVEDARWIYNNCPAGTTVTVY